MFAMNSLYMICVSIASILLMPSPISVHATVTHPIGKLIKGTFVNYDADGNEFARLYICKANGGQYYGSIIRTSDNFENNMIGHTAFSKSDIDYTNDKITNIECFYQKNGKSRKVTPCKIDTANLCDQNTITYSFKFRKEAMSLDFVKISVKDELLGNEDLNGYQCAIPYVQDEAYPYSYTSDPFSWAADIGEAEVYTEDNGANCWSYVDLNGNPIEAYGDFFQRQLFYEKALWIQQWDDQTLPSEDACSRGSQMNVRVDQDVILIGWQCSDGESGAGYLAYKTTDFLSCPVATGV